MLVNLSPNPRARVKAERRYKRMLRMISSRSDQFAKHMREAFKMFRKMYSFKNLFRPYTPSEWEYTKNNPNEDFTGVYITFDGNLVEDSINFWTMQHAPDSCARENYESGDVWYAYGLCDNASQAIQYYKDMKAAGRFPGNHVIILDVMGRGIGWRWHKWGSYIGNFNPCCEYFDDEEGIEAVYAFHIYRIK